MQEIQQENVQSTPSTLSSLGKLRISDNDNFFNDDVSFSLGFNMNRSGSSSSGFGGGNSSSSKIDSLFPDTSSASRDNWVIVDDPPEKSPKTSYRGNLHASFNFFLLCLVHTCTKNIRVQLILKLL